MVSLTGALTLEPTEDGSFTFFSEDFGESFHSRGGAYTEAYITYVTATGLANLAQAPSLTILDVCYGLGYNSAAALATVEQVNSSCEVNLVGLELDARVPQRAASRPLIERWPPSVQGVLKQLAFTGLCHQPFVRATLKIGDARQTIQNLVRDGFEADVIFFDPFSPPHCPELWTVDFIRQVAHCLKAEGRLATYSCAAAVRTAFQQVGLSIGPSVATGRRWPGTLAQWDSQGLAPLSQQEQEHLLTRAAVPYCDPELTDPADRIRQRRHQDQARSDLIPTAHWRKRWLHPISTSRLS